MIMFHTSRPPSLAKPLNNIFSGILFYWQLTLGIYRYTSHIYVSYAVKGLKHDSRYIFLALNACQMAGAAFCLRKPQKSYGRWMGHRLTDCVFFF